MHRSIRFIHSVFMLAGVVLCALTLSCGSDPAAPASSCNEQNPGGFSISTPERGHVYVWGGTGQPGAGDMGRAPGYTRLYWPIKVNFDPAGSPIVLDWNNHRVLAVDGNGKFEKIIGHYFGNPNDGPALEADLNHPTSVTFTPDGTKLVLSAWHNAIVMEMDLATGWIARHCGTGGRCYNLETDPLKTAIDEPVCALFHPITGELYLSDQGNQVIRKIDSNGVLQIVAGMPPTTTGCPTTGAQFGYLGDGGPATSALLSFERGQMANPSGRFCFDAAGDLYIADTRNHVIRIVYPDGTIDTFAGKGPGAGPGFSGDGGPATEAQLWEPRDVVFDDADGSLFIADTGNHVIRRVASDGTISTVVGVVRRPVAPSPTVDPITACALQDEQGAPAREVHLTSPYGIELDAQGNLWIADTLNNVVRIYYR